MNLIAVVPQGLEDIACIEVKEILGCNAIKGLGWISVEVLGMDEAMVLAYRAQSMVRILAEASCFQVVNGDLEKGLGESVSSMSLKKVFSGNCSENTPESSPGSASGNLSFACRAYKIGEEDTPSSEIAAMLGAKVKEITGARVNLNNPDLIISAIIAKDRVLVGIDIVDEDLGKRPYRLFQNGQALKAPLAYALVRESGWSAKKSLLDPFCQAGTVAIEAALWGSGTSPNRFFKERLAFTSSKIFGREHVKKLFDSIDEKIRVVDGSIAAMDSLFPAISASKKNAKIAGIEKSVSFCKLDLEWIDVKWAKESVDAIATVPPMPNRLFPLSKLKGVYQEFLHQARYVLKKNGLVAMLIKSADIWSPIISANGFHIVKQAEVFQGKEPFLIVVLK